MYTTIHENQPKEKIYWHAAFFEALQLELHQYLDALSFIDEHPLSKQALIIDVLVIKKEQNIKIEKNIGRIFRNINIFEFKSEKDSLSVDDYNKAMAYVYLYASSISTHVSDMTLSFAVTVHPRDLLNYLENDRRFIITDSDNGIYRIDGDTFPVQILESKKLSPEKNLFLKNLRSNLTHEDAKRVVEAYTELKEFESRNAYLDRLMRANKSVFREVLSMSETAIREVFTKIWAEESGWLRDRDLENKRENAKAIAIKFLRLGRPVEEVAEATDLPIETAKALIQP